MANGTYKEKLICGGELTVTVDSWFINYYFPGPDLRYNGTFIKVAGDKVVSYIDAFEINWREFNKIKASLPTGSEFEKDGVCGMKIRAGGYFEGVCLAYHYLPIKTEEKLHEIISGYKYALSRAPQISEFLKKL